jgi:restriction system protein
MEIEMNSVKNMWMVRAGEGAGYIESFQSENMVSIGWSEVGDMRQLASRDAFADAISSAYPGRKKGQTVMSVSQVFRFFREIKIGDDVVTYDPNSRLYWLGEILSDVKFLPEKFPALANVRAVRWRAQISRDLLSMSVKNSLGSISTLFLIAPVVAIELRKVEHLKSDACEVIAAEASVDSEEEVDDIYKDVQNKSVEFTTDKVNALDWSEMQELVAGLLRALGYKTSVTPPGPDRGVDIIASPDGFGFKEPRIFVEVKHQKIAMGAPEIRSFLGGRQTGDKCLYVSTGGFTKDARYEADRSRIPLALMDLNSLVRALVEQYESLDQETRQLLPLRKLYWPM